MKNDWTASSPHKNDESPKAYFARVANEEKYKQEKLEQKKSEAIYTRIMAFGIVEFISWILFALLVVIALFSEDILLSLIVASIFAAISLSIDFYVIKNYRGKKEFYQAKNDIIALIKAYKPKFLKKSNKRN